MVNQHFPTFTRPGKRLHNELERSTMLLMVQSTISMENRKIIIFNAKIHYQWPLFVCLPTFTNHSSRMLQVSPKGFATFRHCAETDQTSPPTIVDQLKSSASAAEAVLKRVEKKYSTVT
jgi:hypothetical protein